MGECMLEFTKLQLEHIPLIRPFFWRQNRRVCDCTIGGTFMWREYFDNRFAIEEDTMAMKVRYLQDGTMFTVPIGSHVPEMLDRLEEYCAQQGLPLVFCTATPTDVELLRARFGTIAVEDNRDWYDYLYESQNFITFAGRKYSAQRNHIHKFDRACPNHTFQVMTPGDLDEVREFYRFFTKERFKDGETAQEEEEKTFEVLDHMEQYGLLGGILRVDGRIVGVAMGEIVRDTLFTHIEKANIEYPGVYQKLVNCFARTFATGEVRFINREEDVGDPGLRKSKLSYHPLTLLEKFTVRIGHGV